MPTDTAEIMSLAEKIGQLLKDHPAVTKYKAAQKALTDDPEAARLMGDFNRMLEALGRQEQQGMSVSDAQRLSLETLQNKIVSHIKIKALNLAEVEFYDLLRKISQTYQRPLVEAAGGGGRARSGRTAVGAAMSYWLLKTEPSSYSYDDLARDGKATWDGVSNAAALIHIRQMKKGDLAFIYHTGDEKAVVGVAKVTKDAYADPKQDNPKLAVIDLKPQKKLANPVTLSTIKADNAFAGWDLLRIGRLSVMPVPEKMWKRIESLSK